MTQCNEKKLQVLHDAVKGCNANLYRALGALSDIKCPKEVEFDIGPVFNKDNVDNKNFNNDDDRS